MRLITRSLVILVLSGVCFAGTSFLRLNPNYVNSRLQEPVDPAARVEMLRASFLKAGCTNAQITEQAIPGHKLPNVLCTLPGMQEGSIVIAARLDYTSKGDELAVDNATLNLLPLIAHSLAKSDRRYTLVLLALSGHDRFAGSTHYLSQLTDNQKKSIRGMIFLDQIGRSASRYLFPTQDHDPNPTNVGIDYATAGRGTHENRRSGHVDTPLSTLLSKTAANVKLDDPEELAEFYLTDATTFERYQINALTISSPAYDILVRDLGKREVKMARTTVDFASYYQTYNLLCVYLLSLDSTL